MGIILDAILLIIFCMFVYMGYKKGLVKVIFSLVAIILSLVLTLILYKPITNSIIKNTQIDENIASAIENKFLQNSDENNPDENVNKFLGEYLTESKQDIEKGIVKSSSEIIATNLIGVIVLLILFIAIRIIITILGMLTNTFAELPIVKQFNKIGGTLYGAIEGLLIIYISLAVVFFAVTANSDLKIIEIINSSYITKILYGNNIILKILF